MTQGRKTIQERFIDFHFKHPEVFTLFREYALQAKQAGLKRYSAGAIIERIRWYHCVERGEGETFKINDHYGGRYARWLATSEPLLFGQFFEFRALKSP